MKHLILVIIGTSLFLSLAAQEGEESKKDYGISWSGFVKNDFFFDSRQTKSAREGQFLLYPEAVNEDIEGNDINAQGSINFLSIQSRLKASLSGPDAFGANTSGVIEGAFFGHSNPDINGFRLRHAFVKLDWGNTQVLTGQYWHMMFVPECFPGTISFNTGVPFQYFSRNPQIRLTQALGNKLSIRLAAATQRDFTSPGGYTSLSNTMTPDMQAQVIFNSNNKLIFGLTGGYKQMLPRLETDAGYIAKNSLGGFTSNAFFRVNTEAFSLKLQGIFAQNSYDGLMIGGYAVREVTDIAKDYREYTPVNTLSAWADLHTNGKTFSAGLFAGFSKNMGSFEEYDTSIIDPVTFISDLYGIHQRGSNIDYLYRISPRVIFNSGKFRIAAELEYTTAAYATIGETTGLENMDKNGKITDSEEVSNFRVLLGVYYFF